MATKRRFASLEDEDRENLLENVDAKNTKRQTNTALNSFREYFTEKSLPLDFESYEDEQLDDVLAKFYMEMRNKNGDMYKKSTMQSYRQGLQRHLSKTRDIDILKGDNFKKSKKAYQCTGMTKELKRLGLAAVEHYPAIADVDMEKMYMFFCTDLESPKMLQYKVFVDIMIHFGRRGRENLATLTRQDFAVQPDPEGTLYVYKTHDELTKNHQTDSEKSSDGRMYEIKDGFKAVGVLTGIISKLQMFGLSGENVDQLNNLMASLNQHLKFEIKGHLKMKSPCIDHCTVNSLSDPKYDVFQKKCEHSTGCEECEVVEKALNVVQIPFMRKKSFIPGSVHNKYKKENSDVTTETEDFPRTTVITETEDNSEDEPLFAFLRKTV
ncbi:uncharacterized protein LOC127733511 [Mytilus californianus]|uniref:uncharacterized protein LOC127733511 n=1 Tax=Mytilus californianus TaxID=6549 RepID=UPI002246A638|nr:uncharacterized protein LOC127733511 [Mytilus californianus]